MPRILTVVLIVVLGGLAAACGNPRVNDAGPPANAPDNRPANNQPTGPVPSPAISLQPVYAADARFRTTRTLRVEELTATERYLTESTEVTLTRVLGIDERGRLLALRRDYELSNTRLTKGFGDGEAAAGILQGAILELRRRQGVVQVKVLAGDSSLARQNFLMDGFELALLPMDEVRQGDRWVLDAGALASLNKFIEAVGYKIEKNKLTCVLAAVTADSAEISLDWQITGEFSGKPAVLGFEGTVVFDRKQKLVRQVSITGGRPTGEGARQQIEIGLKRRLTQGWLDLDD